METDFTSKPHACFEVEKVIGVSNDGTYQVQWAPCWVSKFHLIGCEHLIQEFYQQQLEEIKPEPRIEMPNSSKEIEYSCSPVLDESGNDCGNDSNTQLLLYQSAVKESEIRLATPDATDESDLTLSALQVMKDDHASVSLMEQGKVIHTESDGITISRHTFSLSDSSTYIIDGSGDLKGSIEDNISVPNTDDVVEIEDEDDEQYDTDDYDEAIVDQSSLLANTLNSFPSAVKCTDSSRQGIPKIVSESQLKIMFHGSATQQNKFRQCPICAKTYLSSSLKRHLRTHSGTKPFVCDVCTKSFSQKGSLKRHMRVHTGEKPYQCLNCSKQFAELSSLNGHRLRCSSNGDPG